MKTFKKPILFNIFASLFISTAAHAVQPLTSDAVKEELQSSLTHAIDTIEKPEVQLNLSYELNKINMQLSAIALLADSKPSMTRHQLKKALAD